MAKKILVVGCSMTAGHGLEHGRADPKLWVNQIAHRYFADAEVISKAESGINNEKIFHTTLTEITQNNYDVVVIGWTELARFGMDLGLELYKTYTRFNLGQDINVNPCHTISKEWQDKIGNELRRYYNDHWSILKLVQYVNTLVYIQEKTKKLKIYFVNAKVAWPRNYFDRINNPQPSILSTFEKTMLQTDTRDDNEIFQLYNMIHDQYEYCGGICKDNWLNLYESFDFLQVDNCSDTDWHPGYKSQDIFTKVLSGTLDKLLYES